MGGAVNGVLLGVKGFLGKLYNKLSICLAKSRHGSVFWDRTILWILKSLA